MWIRGFKKLQKPMWPLRDEYNEKLPYATIDMDFMNENQAAHGDREFGYIVARLRYGHKVVVGYYKDEAALKEIADWCRVAAAMPFPKRSRCAASPTTCSDVAVTEGDKVEAHMDFGWQVDLLSHRRTSSNTSSRSRTRTWTRSWRSTIIKVHDGTKRIDVVREQASTRSPSTVSVRKRAATSVIVDHFGALHGLNQLPGLDHSGPAEQGLRLRRGGRLEDRGARARSCSTWRTRRARGL